MYTELSSLQDRVAALAGLGNGSQLVVVYDPNTKRFKAHVQGLLIQQWGSDIVPEGVSESLEGAINILWSNIVYVDRDSGMLILDGLERWYFFMGSNGNVGRMSDPLV